MNPGGNKLTKLTPATIRSFMPCMKDEENECFQFNQRKLYESMELEARQGKWCTTYTVHPLEDMDPIFLDAVYQRIFRWLQNEKFYVTPSDRIRSRSLCVSWDPIVTQNSLTVNEYQNPNSNALIRLRTVSRSKVPSNYNAATSIETNNPWSTLSPPLCKKNTYTNDCNLYQQQFADWTLQDAQNITQQWNTPDINNNSISANIPESNSPTISRTLQRTSAKQVENERIARAKMVAGASTEVFANKKFSNPSLKEGLLSEKSDEVIKNQSSDDQEDSTEGSMPQNHKNDNSE